MIRSTSKRILSKVGGKKGPTEPVIYCQLFGQSRFANCTIVWQEFVPRMAEWVNKYVSKMGWFR